MSVWFATTENYVTVLSCMRSHRSLTEEVWLFGRFSWDLYVREEWGNTDGT